MNTGGRFGDQDAEVLMDVFAFVGQLEFFVKRLNKFVDVVAVLAVDQNVVHERHEYCFCHG